MGSKYDSINTAAELVAEVQANGLSLMQEDICRAQDIFGRSAVKDLIALANDIGRDNELGEPDPNGTWSNGRHETRSTFYFVLFKIWNWEDAVRFWNRHSNPEHEKFEELQTKLKAETAEHSKTKEVLKEQRISTDAEHKFLLIERGKRREQGEKIRSLEAELHDRDMTIMELKAKLYDLMVKKEDE